MPAPTTPPILQAMAFVHLALAQLKPRKGDYAGNLARLRTGTGRQGHEKEEDKGKGRHAASFRI